MDAATQFSDSEPLPPVALSLLVRLQRAREAVMARLRPILRAYDLTEQQWRVLRTMQDLGETEISLLAEQVFLLAPSLSRIIRDLEIRGLMSRRLSLEDQRRARVSLTDAGRDLIGRVEPSLARVRLDMRETYGVGRLKVLGGLLEELETALGAPRCEASPD